MKLNRIVGLWVVMLVFPACESRVQAVAEQTKTPVAIHSSTHSHAAKKHAKPGADVRLVNPAPINLVPGKASSAGLVLATSKDAGVLQVNIIADEGVRILSQPKHLEFALTPNGTYAIPLQLIAQTPGRFYLHFQTSLNVNGHILGRSLSVAVQVGDTEKVNSQQEKMAPSSSASSNAVISLPAQETIITP
jgi:hypothetical protein